MSDFKRILKFALRHSWWQVFAYILAVAVTVSAITVPALSLMHLHAGTKQLLSALDLSPRSREIIFYPAPGAVSESECLLRPPWTEAEWTSCLNQERTTALPDFAFSAPLTSNEARRIYISRHEDWTRPHQIELLPSAESDPVLAGMKVPDSWGDIVLSRAAAKALGGVEAGDTVYIRMHLPKPGDGGPEKEAVAQDTCEGLRFKVQGLVDAGIDDQFGLVSKPQMIGFDHWFREPASSCKGVEKALEGEHIDPGLAYSGFRLVANSASDLSNLQVLLEPSTRHVGHGSTMGELVADLEWMARSLAKQLRFAAVALGLAALLIPWLACHTQLRGMRKDIGQLKLLGYSDAVLLCVPGILWLLLCVVTTVSAAAIALVFQTLHAEFNLSLMTRLEQSYSLHTQAVLDRASHIVSDPFGTGAPGVAFVVGLLMSGVLLWGSARSEIKSVKETQELRCA
jgi:hypothetical protein